MTQVTEDFTAVSRMLSFGDFGSAMHRLCMILLLLSCSSVTGNAAYERQGLGAVTDCSACHINAACTKLIGFVRCSCKAGFTGDGLRCSDINECANAEIHGCSPGTCHNTIGSYYCNGSSDVYSSSDPCMNHNILIDPWRSTTPTANGDLHCDDTIHGWYRFGGSGGTRMPENCMPPGRCQTQTPLWLNGNHPVITDGIAYRNVCGNMGSSCCQFSDNIQIKACPGGYHVYNLNRIQSSQCLSAYCTDPAAEDCTADAVWKLGNKGYGCYCKDQYSVSSLSDIRPQLTCELSGMRATFQKCQMKDLGIYFGHESIKDNVCFDFEDDKSKNSFSVLISFKRYGCKVQSSQTGSTVTYRSTLIIEVGTGGIITRNETLTVNLHCVYTLDMMTSLGLALRPIFISTNITVGGVGEFKATMALYKDSSYTTPYEGTEVSLSKDDILYIGVFVEGGDTSGYVLVMTDCYATSTQSELDTKRHYIIQDRCPNKEDRSVRVIENGESRQGRVSVQMFKFVGDYDLVYLHCAVSLCDSRAGICKPLCATKSYQSGEMRSTSPTLRIGPIVRSGSDSSVITGSRGSWALLLPALLLLMPSM